jgi:hypothetical protein
MKLMHLSFVSVVAALAGCGATNANTTPAAPAQESTASTTTTTAAETETETAPKAAEPALMPDPEPSTEASTGPEKCDDGWVCVKVSFDKKKVEKRETKLIGDPKIEQTWSKMSDGRTASFDALSRGTVDLTLRRKPNAKNEVVVKLPKVGEVVIDRREGTVDDFTHVGAIVAEQDGALLVDLKYMK